MHFSIDIDSGDTISGWLAPDNPAATPRFVVSVPGRDEVETGASHMRPDVRELGLHVTGECGFAITTDLVPDLSRLPDVEILEATTRLPIYRRFRADRDLSRKLFLFDGAIIPQRRMLNEISNRFSLCYFNAERNGLETTTALIVNPSGHSIFMSGRASLTRYSTLLKDRGFLRAALLREPHEELAERLFFLSYLAREGDPDSFDQYAHGIGSLVEFARDLPFDDPKALASAFRGITERQRWELTSPMTRVFGCDVDEIPRPANVTQALQGLAELDVMGTRARFPLFRDLLAAVLGANIFGDEEPLAFRAVQSLAVTLSKIAIVNDLLADDLALYSFAEEAITEGTALRLDS